MQNTDRLHNLFTRFRERQCTPPETEELLLLLQDADAENKLGPAMLELWQQVKEDHEVYVADWEKMYTTITSTPRVAMPKRRVVRWWWAAAAAIVLLVAGYWLMVDRRGSQKPDVVQAPQDVAPGHDGAVLTLADGKTIVLDSLSDGLVATQNGSEVGLKDGKLEYQQSGVGSQESGVKYNSLQTPRGRQFQLVLPDGSKVWLNAASSITYPTAFAGNERSVKITGEAYFEVTKNKEKPFIVDVAGKQTVEVLGTHFNINSYDDEDAIRTTLLEGSVKVSATQPETSNPKPETILKPGQQASQKHNQLTTTNNADITQVIAWKNGFFQFDYTPLDVALKQISRWYDVDVVYEKDVPDIKLWGEMNRDLTLTQVMRGLGKMGVHYRIEGKKLFILKK